MHGDKLTQHHLFDAGRGGRVGEGCAGGGALWNGFAGQLEWSPHMPASGRGMHSAAHNIAESMPASLCPALPSSFQGHLKHIFLVGGCDGSGEHLKVASKQGVGMCCKRDWSTVVQRTCQARQTCEWPHPSQKHSLCPCPHDSRFASLPAPLCRAGAALLWAGGC